MRKEVKEGGRLRGESRKGGPPQFGNKGKSGRNARVA